MSTTTIRLPDELEARIEKLTVARGESPEPPLPREMTAEELARMRASARRMGDS